MKISKQIQTFLIKFTIAILILSILAACGPSKEDLNSIDYRPLVRDDWPVSTPEQQGLDSVLVAEMYLNAAELDTLYSLLVIKNGYLVKDVSQTSYSIYSHFNRVDHYEY